jgi:hypothetical protein
MEDFTIENKIIALFGKRNSGKSRLLRYLVNCERDLFKKIFVICPTESINKFYSSMVPDDCIYDSYNNDWCMKLIKKLTDIKTNDQKNKSNVLLILDDCISDTNFHNCPSLNILATRGRHLNISLILTSQYIYAIPPIFRNNCDYIFASQQNKRSVDLMADEFLLGDIDKNEFIKLYNKNTKDYNFFVINCNSVKDNDDLNQIYGAIKTPEKHIK